MTRDRSVSGRAAALLAVAGMIGAGPARAADPIKIGVIARGSVRSRAALIQSRAVAGSTFRGSPDSRGFCGLPRGGCSVSLSSCDVGSHGSMRGWFLKSVNQSQAPNASVSGSATTISFRFIP